MTDPTIWNQLIVWPIINLLVMFYKLFESIGIPGPLGFAIILLTSSIRLLLYPLMAKQLKSTKQMAMIKPKLDELTKKHKGDKQKLQQAQLSLYKEHGINPAAGCLPMLIQFPILIALYRIFFQLLNADNTESVVAQISQVVYTNSMKLSSLDLTFLGIDLTLRPNQWQEIGVWLISVPIVTGLLQFVQTKLMTQGAKKEAVKNFN